MSIFGGLYLECKFGTPLIWFSSHEFSDLSVLQAFPCRCRLGDKENAGAIEDEVRFSGRLVQESYIYILILDCNLTSNHNLKIQNHVRNDFEVSLTFLRDFKRKRIT